MDGLTEALDINDFTSRRSTLVWIVDIADGESSAGRPFAYQPPHEDDRDLDFYLDNTTSFIAEQVAPADAPPELLELRHM